MKHSLYKAQAYSLSSKLFAGGNYMLGCRALAELVCFGGGGYPSNWLLQILSMKSP